MKKIIGLFSVTVIFTAISCSNQPAETKKEVIVVPVTVEKKEPVIIEKEPSTTISLDKNGVKVKSKKVVVDIKPN
jgi:hypothetical protein